MVVHDGVDIRHRREDALVSAGETGHEVRLDEAHHDAPVRPDVLAVHVHVPPGEGLTGVL